MNEQELLINKIETSSKLKKIAVIIILACLVICFIPLLPFVQNLIFSFIDSNISRKGADGGLRNRLLSLLTLPFFGLLVCLLALGCLFSNEVNLLLSDNKSSKMIIILSLILLILALFINSNYSYNFGHQFLHSDHSSEMVLGKILSEENTFVSRNWHYSTELRIIYQTIFTMPLFKILGNLNNWAMIRSLVILFNCLALILSYIFFAKQLKIQFKWILLTSTLLLLPVSTFYWDIVIFGGYYAFLVIQIFLSLGLFIKIINYEGSFKSIHPLFILLTLLTFLLGLQGIRALFSIYIPLLITAIIISNSSKKRFPLFLGIFNFLICCIGFSFNYLLHFVYSFHSFDNMLLANISNELFQKIGQCINSLIGYFGFSPGYSLFSASGLFGIISIIAAFLFFYYVIKVKNFVTIYLTVSLITNVLIFIIADERVTNRYFIPFMVLYIPLLAMFFEYSQNHFTHLKRIAAIMGIVLFLFGQSYLNYQNMSKVNINIPRQGYIKFLLDNDLNFGFATFLNANVTTELTDGKVEILGLQLKETNYNENNAFYINNWLIANKHLNPLYHNGKSFLLLTHSEWEKAMVNFVGTTLTDNTNPVYFQPDYIDNDYVLIVYPSSNIIFNELINK